MCQALTVVYSVFAQAFQLKHKIFFGFIKHCLFSVTDGTHHVSLWCVSFSVCQEHIGVRHFPTCCHIGQIRGVFPINKGSLGSYIYLDAVKKQFGLAINCLFLMILFFILCWY